LLGAIAKLSTPGTAGPAAETPAPAGVERAATKGEGERRHLSVMFVDLVGSTKLSARLDPEQVVHLLKSFREACIVEVAAHDGFISNYMGDGIVVLFGYPTAHEDDAAQALRAGLAIIEAVRALGPKLRAIVPEGLSVRVAVASGIVVVGEMDMVDGARVSSVIGDTPNMAARLQDFAGENGLAASDATRRLAAGEFHFTDLGPKDLKGFDKPVRAWRVEGLAEDSTRFEARTGGQLSDLVGRENELDRLRNRWAHVKSGSGQAVLVSGEAGIGKSRICHTLEQDLADDDYTVVRLQCSPHQSNSALYPFATQLRASAGIKAPDKPGQALAKLLAATPGGDDAVAAQLFAQLLGVDLGEESAALDLSAPEQKRRTLRALWDRLAGLAAERPLAVIVEDAHWIDPTSLGLLDMAAGEIEQLAVLLVVTHRPEIEFDWADRPNVLRMPLTRLGAAEARELVTRVISRDLLSEEMLKEVLAKTDGVPLFIEEMTRMLTDRMQDNADYRGGTATEIPATIYDLLVARLDQLGPAKRFAQQAACFGRQFSRRELARLTDAGDDELDVALEHLTTSDVVIMDAGADTYVFKHALIQNAAYESLLQSKRAELHWRIAEDLEDELANTEPHILAHHFGRALRYRKETKYWRRAGQRSMGASAFVEAATYFRRALEALGTLPEDEAERLELELQVDIAVPLTLTRGWSAPEVGESYTRAHDLCGKVGDSPLLFPARSGIFGYHLVSGQHETALNLSLEYLDHARETGDPAVIVEFEFHPGVALFYSGRLTEALPRLERVVDLYDREKYGASVEIYGRCTKTVALAHLGNTLALLGASDRAFACSEQSRIQSDASGHDFSRIWAMSNHAINHILHEDETACAVLASQVIAEGDKRGFVNWSSQGRVWDGWCKARGGDPEAGLVAIRHGMDVWKMTGAELMRPLYNVLLGEALCLAGRDGEARDALGAAGEIMDRTGENFMRSHVEIARIEIDHALGDLSAGEAAERLSAVATSAAGRDEWLPALKAAAAGAAIDGPAVQRSGLLRQALAQFDGQASRPVLRRAAEIAERSEALAT